MSANAIDPVSPVKSMIEFERINQCQKHDKTAVVELFSPVTELEAKVNNYRERMGFKTMKESHSIEFKEFWRDEYIKWLCGFANADGGVLVIGRNDRGVAVGVANAARLLEELPNKIRDVLGIMADVRLVRESGTELVEVRVAHYPSPISYKGEYYYRSGSTNQFLKGTALDRFLLSKYGRTWDGVPVPKVSLRDLSGPAITLFKKLARQSQRIEHGLLRESSTALIEKLNLVEDSYLKRAAILLFHPAPERFFAGAFIKIGYFRDDAELIYHDEIRGDLFSQVQKLMDLLLTKYLKAAVSYQGIHRIESYPVPEEALREAVLNAIIHRDYSIPAPVQVRVYDNKLCIWNPGILPESWTVKKLLGQHPSCPYNPLVANAFFRAGEIEAWGRGVQRIVKTCRDAGSPVPKIKYEPGDLWLEFPYSPDYLRILSGPTIHPERAGNYSVEGAPDSTRKTAQKTAQKTTQKILSILADEPDVSRARLAELIGGITADGVKYHLAKLKKLGLVRRIGPDKGGHWEVLK